MWLTDENVSIEKKAKYIVISFFITPVIFFAIYGQLQPSRCEEFKNDEFSGKIVKKYIDTQNHRFERIVIKMKRNELFIYTPLNAAFFKSVNINDSLSKKAGQHDLTVYQHDISFKFQPYPNCDD